MFRLGRRFNLPLLTTLALLLSILAPISFTQATAAPALVTCVNLQTGKERISHTGSCRNTQEAQANWRKNQSDSAIGSGASAKVITICSNKESSLVTYQVIRSKCAKHQVTTIFSRSGSLPSKPIIAEAVSFGYDSAFLKLANDPAATQDAPIAYYTITSYRVDTGTASNILTQRIYSWTDLGLAISGLQAQTTYTFTVSATTVDGTSQLSLASLPVTTRAYVAPSSNTSNTLAAPAFTLSKIAETTTAFIASVGFGYTISSTGGAIASYALTGTLPAGLSFSTSTGLITGTPEETRTATTYTITATNAAGSTSATYRLRVTGDLGDTGPGGGTIFYVAASTFTQESATGSMCTTTCRYLEVAPSTWNSVSDPTRTWSNSSDFSYDVVGVTKQNSGWNTSAGVGRGYKDSLAIVTYGRGIDSTTAAAALARAYSGGSKGDWYLPSPVELNLLCQWARGVPSSITTGCTGGALNSATYGASAAELQGSAYWSSTQDNGFPPYAVFLNFGNGSQGTALKNSTLRVRPIRAF